MLFFKPLFLIRTLHQPDTALHLATASAVNLLLLLQYLHLVARDPSPVVF